MSKVQFQPQVIQHTSRTQSHHNRAKNRRNLLQPTARQKHPITNIILLLPKTSSSNHPHPSVNTKPNKFVPTHPSSHTPAFTHPVLLQFRTNQMQQHPNPSHQPSTHQQHLHHRRNTTPTPKSIQRPLYRLPLSTRPRPNPIFHLSTHAKSQHILFRRKAIRKSSLKTYNSTTRRKGPTAQQRTKQKSNRPQKAHPRQRKPRQATSNHKPQARQPISHLQAKFHQRKPQLYRQSMSFHVPSHHSHQKSTTRKSLHHKHNSHHIPRQFSRQHPRNSHRTSRQQTQAHTPKVMRKRRQMFLQCKQLQFRHHSSRRHTKKEQSITQHKQERRHKVQFQLQMQQSSTRNPNTT